jgi:hypothetical protein
MNVRTTFATCVAVAVFLALMALVGAMETEDLVAHDTWMADVREAGEWTLW